MVMARSDHHHGTLEKVKNSFKDQIFLCRKSRPALIVHSILHKPWVLRGNLVADVVAQISYAMWPHNNHNEKFHSKERPDTTNHIAVFFPMKLMWMCHGPDQIEHFADNKPHQKTMYCGRVLSSCLAQMETYSLCYLSRPASLCIHHSNKEMCRCCAIPSSAVVVLPGLLGFLFTINLRDFSMLQTLDTQGFFHFNTEPFSLNYFLDFFSKKELTWCQNVRAKIYVTVKFISSKTT
jgi:hypothetical protein